MVRIKFHGSFLIVEMVVSNLSLSKVEVGKCMREYVLILNLTSYF